MSMIPPGLDLSKIAKDPNPSGAPPNFDNPPSLATTIRAVGVVLGAVAVSLVLARLWASKISKRRMGVDDVSVIVALVLAVALTGILCSDEITSRHSWDVPLSAFDERYVKILFVTIMWYGPMMFFAKASVLLLYFRLFKPVRWLRIGVYSSLSLLFATYFTQVVLAFIYCVPRRGQRWDIYNLKQPKMILPGLVQGSINLAMDIVMLIMPAPIISKLNLPLQKKIGLLAVFTVGILALVASAFTMYYRVKVKRDIDATWSTAQQWICIQSETYATIYVACMPLLPRILQFNFREAKVYTSFRSLLRSKGSTMHLSSRVSAKKTGSVENQSVTALTKKSYEESSDNFKIDAEHAPQRCNGIQKTISIEMDSYPVSREHRV